MKISIIIPVFNEENYILEILKKVNFQKKNYDLEIIVCDDASTDKTLELIKKNNHLYDKLIESKKNQGKGSAIINSLDMVSGKYILIQDADLEYDPVDYEQLFLPALKLNADVVFGSRFQGVGPKRILYFKNRVANFILSLLVSILTDINFFGCGDRV
jgi:glycosyltransferase involved in cell wall biosynthesis